MRRILAALALVCFATPALAAREYKDITCEQSSTSGTGTVTLAGAATNYLPFSTQVSDGATVTYGITSGDGKYETGVGVYTASGTTLTRASSIVSTDGVGTKLTLSGTSTVCLEFNSVWFQPDLGTGDSPTFANITTSGDIELGNASDTTLHRTGAGVASLEGVEITTNSGTQTLTNKSIIATQITAGALNIGNNAATVGTVELANGTANTLSGSSGNLSIEGTIVKKVGTETLWIPANSLACVSPAQSNQGFNSVYAVAAYDPSSTEFCGSNIRMPKNWDLGNIAATFYWAHPSTTTNFGVVWGIACSAFDNDDTLTGGTYSYTTVTDTGGTTSDLYISSATSTFTVAATPAAGKLVDCAVKRDATNGSDTLAVDAYLIGVLITYTSSAANDD